MTTIQKVTPDKANERLRRGDDTLLVCAYDDDEKCRKVRIEGAIPLSELEQRQPPKSQHLIFYCA